jgi:hypothetical protein
MDSGPAIRTPDQRLRVFVSSTLGEMAAERRAVRAAVEELRLAPVMFEMGARPHPPRQLYRAYLTQSHVFVGLYWQRYGWVAPGESVSGLEDEYRLAGDLPKLLYIKEPSPDREAALADLLRDIKSDDRASYRRFGTAEELGRLVADDLSLLLSERFDASRSRDAAPSRSQVAVAPRPLTRTPEASARAAWRWRSRTPWATPIRTASTSSRSPPSSSPGWSPAPSPSAWACGSRAPATHARRSPITSRHGGRC